MLRVLKLGSVYRLAFFFVFLFRRYKVLYKISNIYRYLIHRNAYFFTKKKPRCDPLINFSGWLIRSKSYRSSTLMQVPVPNFIPLALYNFELSYWQTPVVGFGQNAYTDLHRWCKGHIQNLFHLFSALGLSYHARWVI